MKWRHQRRTALDRSKWHRMRIWWPRHDVQSNTTYCLCRVWRRWIKVQYQYWSEITQEMRSAAMWTWEYRDGDECPNVKQAPLAPPNVTLTDGTVLCPHGYENTDACAVCCH